MAIGSFVPRIPSRRDQQVAQVVRAVSAPIIRQQPTYGEKLIGVGPQPYGGANSVAVPSLLGPPPPAPKPAVSVLGKVKAPTVNPSRLIAAPTQAYGYTPPAGLRGPESGIERRKGSPSAASATPPTTNLALPDETYPIVVEAEFVSQSPTYAGDGEQAYDQTFGGSSAGVRDPIGAGFVLATAPAAAVLDAPPAWAWFVGGGVVLAALYWAHRKGKL